MSTDESKINEAQFHDELYSPSGEKETRPLNFYSNDFIKALRDHAINFLGDMKGKKLLFYGCGIQWSLARKFCEQGAEVSMIDISPVAIEFLNKQIADEGLTDRMKPLVMDCESLEYDEGTFDLVFGSAVLHHLDISKASAELSRVMKPGSRASFIEPLGMNPIINFYRRLTPDQRTVDEHPFTSDDFNILKTYFPDCSHEEFTLSALIPVAWNAIAERLGIMSMPIQPFIRFDDVMLRKMAFMRKYCWNTVVYLKK